MPNLSTLGTELGGADDNVRIEVLHGEQYPVQIQVIRDNLAVEIVGASVDVLTQLYTVSASGHVLDGSLAIIPGQPDQSWDAAIADESLGTFQVLIPDLWAGSNPEANAPTIPAAVAHIKLVLADHSAYEMRMRVVTRRGSAIDVSDTVALPVADLPINYQWDIGIQEVSAAPSTPSTGGIGLSNSPPNKVGLPGTETVGDPTDPDYLVSPRASNKAELERAVADRLLKDPTTGMAGQIHVVNATRTGYDLAELPTGAGTPATNTPNAVGRTGATPGVETDYARSDHDHDLSAAFQSEIDQRHVNLQGEVEGKSDRIAHEIIAQARSNVPSGYYVRIGNGFDVEIYRLMSDINSLDLGNYKSHIASGSLVRMDRVKDAIFGDLDDKSSTYSYATGELFRIGSDVFLTIMDTGPVSIGNVASNAAFIHLNTASGLSPSDDTPAGVGFSSAEAGTGTDYSREDHSHSVALGGTTTDAGKIPVATADGTGLELSSHRLRPMPETAYNALADADKRDGDIFLTW